MYPAISDGYVSLYETITGHSIKGREKQIKKQRSANQNNGRPNLVWTLPGGQDKESCGVKRSDSGKLPVKMCMNDPKDFIKAVSNHCGSIRCKSCMNYAAMMAGVRIEDRIMTPNDLRGRISGDYLKPRHWAVSPPQEWIKRVMQRSDMFADLVDDLVKLLPLYGFDTGVIVFHPWRLSDDGKLWELSPHFHVVGFGRFDNMRLREDLAKADSKLGNMSWNDDGRNNSWVFNQIHPDDEIRSVRHTLGYILTHAGIGLYDFDVDFAESDNDLLFPVQRASGSEKVMKDVPTHIYLNEWESTGCYAEHLDQVDWTERHMDKCTSQIQLYRVFGSANKLRVFDVCAEDVERLCPECGAKIGLFQGFDDPDPQPVVYKHTSKIRCFRDSKLFLEEYWRSKVHDFRMEGMNELEFAMSVPQLSTPETKGLQEYRTKYSQEHRKRCYDSVLVYKPIVRHGCPGFQPLIVTRNQAEILRSNNEVI